MNLKAQKVARGFVEAGLELSYHLSIHEKLALLKSDIPTDRTIAARLLKSESPEIVIEYLIDALKIEKKLYPKIEISKTLTWFGQHSVKPLIKLLGKIGNNQHKKVPESEFKKDNYPLPRDIAARILAHIGISALPELMNSLPCLNIKQVSEAIDAIGFICFYEYSEDVYTVLYQLYNTSPTNDLIKWKLLRAFSSFKESYHLLLEEITLLTNQRLKLEAARSIRLVEKRNTNGVSF